jgi:hypothetical protein
VHRGVRLPQCTRIRLLFELRTACSKRLSCIQKSLRGPAAGSVS